MGNTEIVIVAIHRRSGERFYWANIPQTTPAEAMRHWKETTPDRRLYKNATAYVTRGNELLGAVGEKKRKARK